MNKDFRTWLRELWYDNCEEHRQFKELPYTTEEYFQKYKYWLKREYQYQKKKEQAKQDEVRVAVDSNFIMDAILNDKLDSTGARLLSNSQQKLIRTLKDNNEK